MPEIAVQKRRLAQLLDNLEQSQPKPKPAGRGKAKGKGTVGRASYKNVASRPYVYRRPGAIRSARGCVSTNRPGIPSEQTISQSKQRRGMGKGKGEQVGTKLQVFRGTADKTSGGLRKSDLTKNRRGKVVSKKQMARGQELYRKFGGLPETKGSGVIDIGGRKPAMKLKARGTVHIGGAEGVKKVGSKREVFNGSAEQTAGGLKKGDLVKNQRGKVVSKRQLARGRELYKRYGSIHPFQAPITQSGVRR